MPSALPWFLAEPARVETAPEAITTFRTLLFVASVTKRLPAPSIAIPAGK